MPRRVAIRNLATVCYANGFTLWHYRGGADLDAVSQAGYFNDAADHFGADDLIMVTSKAGARILCVTVAAEGAVVVAPLC